MSKSEPLFYDITAIKNIPILDIADRLGISVQKRGKNHWCKVREEKNPSVVLHPDRNSFYDFGNQMHGDGIRFVQYVNGSTPGEAIHLLGEMFGIERCLTREQMVDRPLTNWEYSQIGLHGDRASKNIVFPIETASLEELADISWAYQMPLNELQKQEPKLFRGMIAGKAIPQVEFLRNQYYREILNRYHLAYMLGDNSMRLYRAEEFRHRFQGETARLNRAEMILYRACRNAGMEVSEPVRHDAPEDLKGILHGQITFALGCYTQEALSEYAARVGCDLYQTELSYGDYCDPRISGFDNAAEYRRGKVNMQFLASDLRVLAPILKAKGVQWTPVSAVSTEKTTQAEPSAGAVRKEIHQIR